MPIAVLGRCRQALESEQPAVFRLEASDANSALEKPWLFSTASRTGILVSFSAGKGRRGLLAVAEQREWSKDYPSSEYLDFVKYVASRLGDILDKERSLKERHIASRRRQRLQLLRGERKRLSRELHDGVGQSLNAVLMQIRLASARGQAGIADLRLLEIATQQALDRARIVAYGLRDVVADPIGEARAHAELILANAACSLSWIDERKHHDVNGRVPRELSAAILESVTNVVRHARAQSVTVRLTSTSGGLQVTIQDDGIGFSPESVTLSPDGRGLGLLGMAERLRAIGGAASVRSVPSKGTTVVLEVVPKSASPGIDAVLIAGPPGVTADSPRPSYDSPQLAPALSAAS